MVSSRAATALAGIAVSLAVSYLVWRYVGTLLLFLFVPFVPYLLRGSGDEHEERPVHSGDRKPPTRTCPACGFSTRDPDFEFCPRDGTALEQRGRE